MPTKCRGKSKKINRSLYICVFWFAKIRLHLEIKAIVLSFFFVFFLFFFPPPIGSRVERSQRSRIDKETLKVEC